jgi:hypothetical protein
MSCPGFQTASPFTPGQATHYDYKPWRPAGSFLNWLFVVIPLCDYTDEAGPAMGGPVIFMPSCLFCMENCW